MGRLFFSNTAKHALISEGYDASRSLTCEMLSALNILKMSRRFVLQNLFLPASFAENFYPTTPKLFTHTFGWRRRAYDRIGYSWLSEHFFASPSPKEAWHVRYYRSFEYSEKCQEICFAKHFLLASLTENFYPDHTEIFYTPLRGKRRGVW